METKQILRVAVASPGDVAAERALVDKVLDEINRSNAADRGTRLEVFRWERDTYPCFHAEGPQGLIDPLLDLARCDLVVGIFWKRFGTPRTDGLIGTEHELRNALKLWRAQGRPQIMIYFNQRPYTPKNESEVEQWGKVLRFRREFPKEGLWWNYCNRREFEELPGNHLNQWLRRGSVLGASAEVKVSVRVWAQKDRKAVRTRDITLVPRKPLTAFEIGDRVLVGTECSTDAFLVLINEGSSGKQTVLLPNSRSSGAVLRGGVTYWFPNPADEFDFVLCGAPGSERIRGILTTAKVWKAGVDTAVNLERLTQVPHSEARCSFSVQ
jgi:hypothetical protein